jgi:hypothetical protein
MEALPLRCFSSCAWVCSHARWQRYLLCFLGNLKITRKVILYSWSRACRCGVCTQGLDAVSLWRILWCSDLGKFLIFPYSHCQLCRGLGTDTIHVCAIVKLHSLHGTMKPLHLMGMLRFVFIVLRDLAWCLGYVVEFSTTFTQDRWPVRASEKFSSSRR